MRVRGTISTPLRPGVCCCRIDGTRGFYGAPCSKALIYMTLLGMLIGAAHRGGGGSDVESIAFTAPGGKHYNVPAMTGGGGSSSSSGGEGGGGGAGVQDGDASRSVMGDLLSHEVNSALRTAVLGSEVVFQFRPFDLRSSTLYEWRHLHRLAFSQLFFATFGETVAGCALFYAMRDLERLLGSPKFALLGVATAAASTAAQAALLALGGVRWGVVVVAAGPYALLFTLLALYLHLVPPLRPRIVVLCGRVALSEKTPVVLLAVQLLLCRGAESLVAGLAGAAVGTCLHLPLWLRRAALRRRAQTEAPRASRCAQLSSRCGLVEGTKPWDDLIALVRHPTDGFRDGRVRRACGSLRDIVDALPPASWRGELPVAPSSAAQGVAAPEPGADGGGGGGGAWNAQRWPLPPAFARELHPRLRDLGVQPLQLQLDRLAAILNRRPRFQPIPMGDDALARGDAAAAAELHPGERRDVGGAATGGAGLVGPPPASSAVAGLEEASISQLEGMGFPRTEVVRALQRARGDRDLATEFLLIGTAGEP
tara:strand:+ start:40 stop:1653 length:1614 start_codon:yes stop_codon:yes gene_type:complete